MEIACSVFYLSMNFLHLIPYFPINKNEESIKLFYICFDNNIHVQSNHEYALPLIITVSVNKFI